MDTLPEGAMPAHEENQVGGGDCSIRTQVAGTCTPVPINRERNTHNYQVLRNRFQTYLLNDQRNTILITDDRPTGLHIRMIFPGGSAQGSGLCNASRHRWLWSKWNFASDSSTDRAQQQRRDRTFRFQTEDRRSICDCGTAPARDGTVPKSVCIQNSSETRNLEGEGRYSLSPIGSGPTTPPKMVWPRSLPLRSEHYRSLHPAFLP